MVNPDEDQKLLLEISRVNKASGLFAAGVLDDALSPDDQRIFARRLVDLALLVNARAERTTFVVDGSVDGV